jgi:hypothetical protein
MKRFSYRLGNLEAQTCDKHLIHLKPDETIEISQWGDGIRWVIAHFVKHSEGFDLHFCGSRPFYGGVNPNDFMSVAKLAADYLAIEFEAQDE